DHRFVVYNRPLKKNIESYLPWEIQDKLKLEWISERIYRKGTDFEYTQLKYRDCKRGLTYEIKLYHYYDKVTIGIQWFGESVREGTIDLRGCKIDFKQNKNDSYEESGSDSGGTGYKRPVELKSINRN